VDIVSRNGNLMLNFPLPSSGMLDDKELAILAEITDWMRVNSEGIYDTRPWKVFGTGPGSQTHTAGSSFNENKKPELGSSDLRFTRKGNLLYVFFMGWPEGKLTLKGLGSGGPYDIGKFDRINLCGQEGNLEWNPTGSDLEIALPGTPPCKYGYALRFTTSGV